MDSELLEKEYNELLYGLDTETAEKFRKFVEGFRTNLKALSGYAEIDFFGIWLSVDKRENWRQESFEAEADENSAYIRYWIDGCCHSCK